MKKRFHPLQAYRTQLHMLLPAIAYMVFYLAWWFYLENHRITRRYDVIHMAIDDYIPFCEVFVVPYLLWFAYVSLTVLYFCFKKEKEDYLRTCVFLFTGMTIFLIVSTLWPNEHHLRLTSMPRDNVFTALIAALWKTDTASNLWPSIHVYNALGAHFAIVQSREFEHRRGIRIASLILCVSIIASTVLIKQHSMYDVLTALIMAAVMFFLVYRTDLIPSLEHKWNHRKHTKPETV